MRALINSSQSGEIVADWFGGAGSTLIACEQHGRQAKLMEIDPRYVDVTVARWQRYTGEQATLEGDGRTYQEVAQCRYQKAARGPEPTDPLSNLFDSRTGQHAVPAGWLWHARTSGAPHHRFAGP